MRVERSLTELPGGGYLYGPPKWEAGRRRVVFPAHVTAALETHLAEFAAPEAGALVLATPAGTPLRHSNFRRRVWLPALDKAGLAELHFYDLRHTGNHLTAAAGATLREMMDRMGHSSTRAALIYMHGSDARQREIADTLSKIAESELPALATVPGGHLGARHRERSGHGKLGMLHEVRRRDQSHTL